MSKYLNLRVNQEIKKSESPEEEGVVFADRPGEGDHAFGS
jgi:hypothetical protein